MDQEITNINPEDTRLEEAVQTLMQGLPKPVQEFLTSPERATLALQLTRKYNLHADQAGAFERAFIFMLLGIATPEQFVSDLRKEGIPEEAIQALAKDVNEQVFIKLRNEERNNAILATPVSPTTPPTVQPAPAYKPPIPVAVPSVSQFSASSSAPAPVPTPTLAVVQAPATPRSVPTPSDIPMHAHTMEQDMRAAATPTPSPTFQTATPAPKPPSQNTQNRDALHAVLKEYGVDPYREPPV